MRTICLVVLLILTADLTAQVGIGTASPNASAVLDLNAADKGFLPPRLTTEQRNNIANPPSGLTIYNITSNCLEFYRTMSWWNVCSGRDATLVPTVQKLIGGSGNDIMVSMEVVPADDSYILAGYANMTNGDLSGLTNNGGQDFWIAKTNATGQLLWQKMYGGSSFDQASSIKPTADGGYIVVGTTSSPSGSGTLTGTVSNGVDEILVMKLDASGNVEWQKMLGGSAYEAASGVCQINDGSYVVVGYTQSSNSGTLTGLTNNGSYDGWIIKLSSSGAVLWQKLLGGGSSDLFFEVTATTDGGCIAAGKAGGAITGAGTGYGNEDGWFVKLDAAGTIQWQKLFGGTSTDEFRQVSQTSDGGYIAGGISYSSNSGTLTGVTNHSNPGSSDVWVLKLTPAGDTQWQQLIGGSGVESYSSLQPATDGGYILTSGSAGGDGTFGGMTSNGNSDCWIFKLSSSGELQWQQQ